MPQAVTPTEIGPLPRWDLSDLYPGRQSPALAGDLADAEKAAAALAERFRGRLAEIDGNALAELLDAYEAIAETLGRVMSYAYLDYAGDVGDAEAGRFLQTMQEKVNAVTTTTLFVTLELNRIDEAVLGRQLEAPKLARWRPWI